MKILVTGGGGFLGTAVSRMLTERGDTVRTLARNAYPHLDALGVEQLQGDIADEDAVRGAAEGCDAIVHTAAKAGVWGSLESYRSANVRGTENVLAACKAHRISKLVYTSTPSVTFRGVDENGVDESEPYADTYLCHYAATKAEAEQKVLAANGANLSTVALRPHLIWGPGDNHLVPRLIDRGRRGRIRIVGYRDNLVDSTYIDNAAKAHVLALDRLAPDAACAGKAYFISNGEPMAMGDLINAILATAEVRPVTRRISEATAYRAGALLEMVYRFLGKEEEPMMTRFVARQLATAHWFDLSAATADLGYVPEISIAEGLERLRADLSTL